MTLGAWRKAARSARAKVWVSLPTSRWLIVAFSLGWRYSMGSSMVMMWIGCSWLIFLMMAARVVDLPEPVGPVTRMMPFLSFAMRLSCSGSPSWATVGISFGITRRMTLKEPRWEKTLTRNRVRLARL